MKIKKLSKIFTSIIIALVVIGLTLPLIGVFAAETTPLQENLQTPLEQVQNKVDELVELKDNSTLSDQEKESQEIQIRKEALDQIVDLSLAETKNLEDKLNALTLESDDQKAAKEKFLEILDRNINYSVDLKKNIDKENITLDEVKNLAQEYKDWRADNYGIYVKKITAFTLVFQEKAVLKIANIRLDKIMSDLKNLQNAKILKKEDTWNLINLSMKSLTNAKIFNSNAETIISKSIKKDLLDVASSTPASEMASTSPENLTQTATSSLSEKLGTSGLATSTISTATTTSALQITAEEDKAQVLIEKSLKEIKNAYNYFISISNIVNKKLKIK